MKGIILAAGRGSRLYPLTKVVNKQLLQIYDKPMIYYPLSTLMLLNIKDILIITNPKDLDSFKILLGNGSRIGIKISYATQDSPKGIADAFNIADNYIGDDNVTLILGDNIFYGHGFLDPIRKIIKNPIGATVFGYPVNDPERYGVVEFDSNYNVLSIEEKPIKPKSNYAVPGIYIYDNKVVNYAKTLNPSKRGELEITDINKIYLNNGKLKVNLLGRGVAWLDTGKPNSLFEASTFISYIEARQGLKISCIEEVAYNMGYISKQELKKIVDRLPDGSYKDYLFSFLISINS
ncbi:MAG: glucose-1-phosphate thymidylyltransferase [Candidatus Marinimicrobia bacterium]|nr:glucose-1-phosphate thymidylyltransferase [Candidatus Neomarinimicrobiota bacterium]|tara:strand:+ start:19423 stop:20298 length:876 start_codon:yes stop_codon:yes gene_type:complete